MSRENVNYLSHRLAELDEEIGKHGQVLKANNIGMNEPLVDADGFPFANIDVMSVRKARHAIICLQNNRKALMQMMETEMAQVFEMERNAASFAVQQQQQCEKMEVDPSTDSDAASSSLEPFIVVDKVESGQLADQMGLQVGDLVLQIGTLTAQNFQSIHQIQSVLNNSRGKKLRFIIRKASTGKNVILDMDIGSEGTRLGIFAKPLKI